MKQVNLLDDLICTQYNRCSNELVAEVPTNAINCSIPFTNEPIPRNCHLEGSDNTDQQIQLIYLLRITADTLILHYFNDTYGSQHPSDSQHLCAANNVDNIAKVISEICILHQESAPAR